MKTGGFLEAESIISKKQLYIPLLRTLDVGLVLCEAETLRIIYMNPKAYTLLDNAPSEESGTIYEIFDGKEIQSALSGKDVDVGFGASALKLKALSAEGYVWFSMEDRVDELSIKNISNQMLEMNKELREFFNEYGDENVVVTDGKGLIEFAGEDIARTCGVESNYFMGKSVYDMEKARIFYPSVTVRVLETSDMQVILQKTKNSEELVSIGAPIFNDKGQIEKVVSITKDFTKQLRVSSMLASFGSGEKGNPGDDQDFKDFVTCSEKMAQLKWMIKLVAPTNSTILISGETGTGKEVVAKNIARLSVRRDKPFVKVNCGTISPTIVESELFGYEPGSFTGAIKGGKKGLIEAANGGTLFLDEVSELPIEQQVKLLHVLQEKMLIRVGGTAQISLDIRVIAASNKNLEEEIKLRNFREDLFYRLNVVPINIPPLRERTEDIPLLVRHFLSHFNEEYDKKIKISHNASRILQKYAWPGNVRELENTVERMVVTSSQNMIDEKSLPEKIKKNAMDIKEEIQVHGIMKLSDAIETVEKKLIEQAMHEYGTTTKIAAALGVNQSTISRKIQAYGLRSEES